MSYLSDDEENNQNSAKSKQDNFDITQPVSSPQGGSDQSSQQNASGYEQSTGGGGTSAANTSTKTSPIFNQNSTGLGSSTPGGGFVNFNAYENANPSTSGKISSGGKSLLGSEEGNFSKATALDPASGFSSDPNGAPGNTLSDKLSSLPSWATGGHDFGASLPSFDTATGAVQDAAQNDPSQLGKWINETYTAPTYDYVPSTQWTTEAPELSQTPGSSGQAPSVVDYLASSNISAGNYTPGERSLDQAIIAGDPLAQSAIAKNKNDFGNFQTNVASTLSGLASTEAADSDLAKAISGTATTDANNLASSIMNGASDLAGQTNSKTEADKKAEEKAFLDWYNSGGYNTGTFTVNNVPGSSAQAAGELTPQQITELNNIAIAQGQAPPYPTTPQSNGSPGSYGFTINPGPSANAGPSDLPPPGSNLSEGGLNPTGLEQAAESGVNLSPEQVQGMIGQVSTPDLQAIFSEWTNQEQQEKNNGDEKGALELQKQLGWISEVLQGRQQTPSSLAASLGLTPADMAALGF